MPSPFPGMDPYLEDPRIFPDLHDTFLIYLRSEIQQRLPANYVACVEERTWIETSDRAVEADVSVHRVSGTPGFLPTRTADGAVITEPVVVSVKQYEAVETFISIYELEQNHRELVTSIEVLSPTNKRAGNRGQALYQQKQAELLERPVNLVEIDLLRRGRHSTAVPQKILQRVAEGAHYHVCVRDLRLSDKFLIYPIRLTDALPVIEVPLKPDDSGIGVPLQAALARAVDDGRFPLRIDYRQPPPPPPLADDELAWVKGILTGSTKSPTKEPVE